MEVIPCLQYKLEVFLCPQNGRFIDIGRLARLKEEVTSDLWQSSIEHVAQSISHAIKAVKMHINGDKMYLIL
jgi:hypothetical protein